MYTALKLNAVWDFPDSPVVKNCASTAGGMVSISGQIDPTHCPNQHKCLVDNVRVYILIASREETGYFS